MGPSSAKLNLAIQLGPLAAAFMLMVAMGLGRQTSAVLALVFCLVSLVSLLIVKARAFKSGRWASWGPGSAGSLAWLWWVSLSALLLAVLFTFGSGAWL